MRGRAAWRAGCMHAACACRATASPAPLASPRRKRPLPLPPCNKQTLGPGNSVTGVEYATVANAAACAATFTLTYQAVYAGAPSSPTRNISVALPPSAVRVMACGVAAARGAPSGLPAGTCASLGAQLAAQTNLTAPITDQTALYVLDLAQVLPTYTGIANLATTTTLSRAVPALYRNFGLLNAASFSRPISVAGRNRPQEQRALYNAPLERRGTARGLLVGTSLFVPYPCEWWWW